MSGIDGLALIRVLAPTTPLAMMSGVRDATIAHAALAQGANGFVSKAAGGRELKNALRMVLNGETYISPCVLTSNTAEPLPEPAAPTLVVPLQEEETLGTFGMTVRQLEVCRLLMVGLPNKMIARKLDCAEGTIRLHVSAVLRALNVRNRTEVVQVALRLGIASA